MKTYFELEDNIMYKKLQKYIDDMTFSSKKNVKEVIKRIISCYAQNFCNGNEDKAKTLLTHEGERRDEAQGFKSASFLRWNSIVNLDFHLVRPAYTNY
jgi:hypothetical protein